MESIECDGKEGDWWAVGLLALRCLFHEYVASVHNTHMQIPILNVIDKQLYSNQSLMFAAYCVCRYITVVAVDVDGGQSPTAVVSITFSTACSQWPDTMTVVPVNASLEQIGQCSSIDTSINELKIDSSSSVVNLLPLRNLRVSCMLLVHVT